MEKTGLINELTERLNVKFLAFAQKESTSEAVAYSESCVGALQSLKEIAASRDPEILLRAEKALLDDELQHYANMPEMASSLNAAQKEIDSAFKALGSLLTPGEHQILANSLSHKDIQNGLPLDASRKFECSHQTRLANHLKGNVPLLEKEILRQRKDNLKIAKEAYIDMQYNALKHPEAR